MFKDKKIIIFDLDGTLIDFIDIWNQVDVELVKEHKPYGLKENREMAKRGGRIARNTRDDLEKELGRTVITKQNALNYKYIDDNKLDKDKQLNDKSKKLKANNSTEENYE